MRACLAVLVVVAVCSCAPAVKKPPAADGTPLFTPRWAFEPWISKDISTGADMDDFIAGFQSRDIPVGVAVLDSPWETNYNTFVPNDARYPDFAGMVARWRDEGIRTVLWTTQMVNSSSFDLEEGGDSYPGPASNFQDGVDHGYFVDGGATSLWWKGTGAAVDFFNPDARAWWHAQQRPLLDAGVAGFKLDFGEQYIHSNLDEPIDTAAGKKSLQEYSEAYYRDFLENGVATVGSQEFIIMPRAYDESYGFPPRFYARPGDAPVTWVGDQSRDWQGLADALDHIFHSVAAGYAVTGSDIGGYLDTRNGASLPFDGDVFRAWTAMSAMTPLFQLHGRANLAPWTVPDDVDATVASYRYWATLHHALAPFFFSLVREAQLQTPDRAKPNAGVPVLHVVGEPDSWAGDYRFFVGDAFFVAPLLAPGRARDVTLPVRDDGAGYVDWWDLAADAVPGGTTVSFAAPDETESPLYLVEGAIVPLVVDSDALSLPAFPDALTVVCVPGPSPTSFTFHDDDDSTGTISLTPEAGGARISLADLPRRAVLRVRVDDPAARTVTVDGAAASAAASVDDLATGDAARFDDAPGRAVWVAVPGGAGDVVIR